MRTGWAGFRKISLKRTLSTCIEERLKCPQQLWESFGKTQGKLSKSRGKSIVHFSHGLGSKAAPCIWISAAQIRFLVASMPSLLLNRASGAISIWKTSQSLHSARFAELMGEEVFIFQGELCCISVPHKYLILPITRATTVSWSNVFKEQKYFSNIKLLLYICRIFTERRKLSFPFRGLFWFQDLKKNLLWRKSSKLKSEIILFS